jgi:hypothetical protein
VLIALVTSIAMADTWRLPMLSEAGRKVSGLHIGRNF